ncbi:hypothetical protein GGD38_000057 [Chitinophagaceae bacterium OAS944]|nr:hypothetical protein [Chitinophagaceae bacterium OAS944]
MFITLYLCFLLQNCGERASRFVYRLRGFLPILLIGKAGIKWDYRNLYFCSNKKNEVWKDPAYDNEWSYYKIGCLPEGE